MRHTLAGTNHEPEKGNPMSGNRRLLQRQMKQSSGVRLMLNRKMKTDARKGLEREKQHRGRRRTSGNYRNQIETNNTQEGSSSQNRLAQISGGEKKNRAPQTNCKKTFFSLKFTILI
jgi:hypothetical protein